MVVCSQVGPPGLVVQATGVHHTATGGPRFTSWVDNSQLAGATTYSWGDSLTQLLGAHLVGITMNCRYTKPIKPIAMKCFFGIDNYIMLGLFLSFNIQFWRLRSIL